MFNWFFEVGNAWHSFMEARYSHQDHDCILQTHNFNPKLGPDTLRDGRFEIQLEYWQQVFPVLCRMYEAKYRTEAIAPTAVEQVVTRTFMGVNFRGKIDLMIGGTETWDHKTASNIDPQGDKLKQKFQFVFYKWLRGNGGGAFTVNMLKKPAQRMGKKETESEFACRVAGEIVGKPDEYFARETTHFSDDEIQQFESSVMVPIAQKLQRLLGGNDSDEFLWTQKTYECCNIFNTPCPFMPLCFEDEALKDIYFERKTSKHEELEAE